MAAHPYREDRRRDPSTPCAARSPHLPHPARTCRRRQTHAMTACTSSVPRPHSVPAAAPAAEAAPPGLMSQVANCLPRPWPVLAPHLPASAPHAAATARLSARASHPPAPQLPPLLHAPSFAASLLPPPQRPPCPSSASAHAQRSHLRHPLAQPHIMWEIDLCPSSSSQPGQTTRIAGRARRLRLQGGIPSKRPNGPPPSLPQRCSSAAR